MGVTHNSNIQKREPSWGSVDKTSLPRVAFADHGDSRKKSSWSFPHHHIFDGTKKDENGIWQNGTMFLNSGGLKAAWAAAMGARSGEHASPHIIAHLRTHRRNIGVEKMGAKSNRKMSPMVNYKKSLESDLTSFDIEKELAFMLATQDLEISFHGKKKEKDFMPVKQPTRPLRYQIDESDGVSSSAGNLSQDQLADLQDPNSGLLELGDLEFEKTELEQIAIQSPEKDNSPQKPIEINPGNPMPDPGNAAAMALMKKMLPLIGVLDIRGLWQVRVDGGR